MLQANSDGGICARAEMKACRLHFELTINDQLSNHSEATKGNELSIRPFSKYTNFDTCPADIRTTVQVFVVLPLTFDPVRFGFSLRFRERTKELSMTYVHPACRHHQRGLRLPIVDI